MQHGLNAVDLSTVLTCVADRLFFFFPKQVGLFITCQEEVF